MPFHQRVAKHGDATRQLVTAITSHPGVTYTELSRLMAADVIAHKEKFVPATDLPDIEKKAASLRRQLHRWSAGDHVPDMDDLGCLLRVARRHGWLAAGGPSISGTSTAVQALVADVDAAEDERRSLEIEAALETHRLELQGMAKRVAWIAERMPGRLDDVGLVFRDLCEKLIEEVSPAFPLGTGAVGLRATGMALQVQWSKFAQDVEEEGRETLASQHLLIQMEDDVLRAEFEERACAEGLWPEDLGPLWRWVRLGPASFEAGAAAVDPKKLRHFWRLLRSFQSRAKRGFELSKRSSKSATSRTGVVERREPVKQSSKRRSSSGVRQRK